MKIFQARLRIGLGESKGLPMFYGSNQTVSLMVIGAE
jgi:hypothetical protein